MYKFLIDIVKWYITSFYNSTWELWALNKYETKNKSFHAATLSNSVLQAFSQGVLVKGNAAVDGVSKVKHFFHQVSCLVTDPV